MNERERFYSLVSAGNPNVRERRITRRRRKRRRTRSTTESNASSTSDSRESTGSYGYISRDVLHLETRNCLKIIERIK
ncbi:hypothetical protein CRE_05221 [Caenorhabditis remanei]|uniref:Uncharacterized protein n=1 Tax=Caenorhabditis remanei TaxID=31234 RepID=E3NE89_CAERE|nr:hypothetical protein CRE_05221 [Caenorhabditis remanei]